MKTLLCRRHRRALGPWLDGELSPRRAARLEAHLATCAACAAAQQRLEATRRAFRSLRPSAPSPGFDAALRRRIAAEPRPAPAVGHRHLRPALRALAAGIALAAVALALLWGLRGPGAAAPGSAAGGAAGASVLAWPDPPAAVVWEGAGGTPMLPPEADSGTWGDAPCASAAECSAEPPCGSSLECGAPG